MDRYLNARFRLTLADADAGGGSGGGRGPQAQPPADYQPTTTTSPLPGQTARASLYDRLTPDSEPQPDESGTKPPDPTPDPGEGGPESPPQDADSAPAPTEGEGEGTDQGEGKQSKRDKRVSDAQRALHESKEETRKANDRATKAESELELARKYVDFDKLREFDKEQSTKDLDKPLTKRDLQDLRAKPPETPPPQEPGTLSPEAERERQVYVEAYTKKHPHMKDRLTSKEAYGVFLKTAEELGPEATLDEIGDAVADHFARVDAQIEKRITERITKQRKNLTSGDSPRSGGTPRTGDETAEVSDKPEDYIAERRARQNRAMRPQT